jgi:hypothetical protein
VLVKLKDELERHLRQRFGDLFDPKCELLLSDITSTYFEGQCAVNPLARRGYSRDSRPDGLLDLMAKKSSFWPAAPIARPRSRPCTSVSFSASRTACADPIGDDHRPLLR